MRKHLTIFIIWLLILSGIEVGIAGKNIALLDNGNGNSFGELSTSTAAYDNYEFLPRVNIVNITDDFDTNYWYYAAIPMTVFHYNAKVYQSLLLSDHINESTTQYLLDDWSTYLDAWGGVQHVNFIGGVSNYTKSEIMNEYTVGWDQVTNITGDPITVANLIAEHDWKYTNTIVIAPYLTSPMETDIESITNAAVIASLTNAPLLFTDPTSLSTETLTLIDKLNVSYAILVEINNTLDTTIETQLQSNGVTITDDLTNETAVVTKIRTLTGQSTLCSILLSQQGMPASLAGARYGGYVLFLPENIRTMANTLGDMVAESNQSNYKLDEPMPLPDPLRSGEEALAQDFYDWLDTVGGNDTSQLETVITFNTQPYYDATNGFSVTFERAISGDPSDTSNAGAVSGRMPLKYIGNIALENRDGMYRATIFSNPRPYHVTLAMNAYEVQHTAGSGVDKWGGNHIVNEIFGWPYRGWCSANNNFPWQDIQNNTPDLSPILPPGPGDGPDSDPGQFASFNESYETHFHSGAYPGTGSHPAQPNVNNIGFVNDMNNGSVFLYFSCHGGGTSIAVRNTDNGVAQDPSDQVPWADDYWPSTDGRVYDGSAGGSYSQDDLDNDLGNVHGAMTAYNACLMANGKMNEVLLEHGGTASFGSYTSVSFTGSGWWWNIFVHLCTHEGYTIGEAATYATARVAKLYTPGANNGPGNPDTSLQYVVYGDPNVQFVQTNWTSPEPEQINVNYGGHKPDKPPHSFNVTITPSEIPIGGNALVTVTVLDADNSSPLVANVSITGWGVNEHGQTANDGTVSFTVNPPYGENLTVTVEKEDYDTYYGVLVVTGGAPVNGTITAYIPSLGVHDVLAPSYLGMINATANITGYMLSANGCGVNATVNTTTTTASLNVTPVTVGTIQAAILKTGCRIVSEEIPVLTLHLNITYQPSTLTVDYEETLDVTISCVESGSLIENVNVTVQGCGVNQSAMTDSNGLASFTVTPTIDGVITISAYRDGFQQASTQITVLKADMTVTTRGTIWVYQQLPLHVYVNNSITGAPLSDAEVTVEGCGVNENGVTQNGVATIIVQPSSTGVISVTVTREGYNPGGTTLTVTVGPTGDLQGTVTDANTSLPINGVFIEVYNASVDPAETDPAFDDTTDSTGFYAISDMPIGGYIIQASKFGYMPYENTVDILENNTVVHDIALVPAVTYMVQGMVTDANTGEALAADITVYREDTMEEIVNISVPNGNYSVQLVPYTYVFKVEADMHKTVWETIQVVGDTHHDFMLEPAIFFDDVENGENGWTHTAASGSDLWHISSRESHSSSHAWYCGSELTGEYENNMDDSLVTPVFNFSGFISVNLTFWHRYDFEQPGYYYDGGDVEISVDGGAWQQITPLGGYDGTIQGGGNAAFSTGTPVYAGNSGGWKQAEFDLSPYVDHEVQIRFRFGSDGSVTYEGWYIDDIIIYGKTPTSHVNITVLASKWNFVSLPFNQSLNKTVIMVSHNNTDYTWDEAVNLGLISNYLFGWNRVGQTYTFNDVLEPGYGYWLYAYDTCELWVENVTIIGDDYVTDLKTGWNVMGVPHVYPVDKNTLIVAYNGVNYTWADAVGLGLISDYIFGWNRASQTYGFSDTLNPGECYWMYAFADLRLYTS